jgi:UDP-galactopyranose mutase
MPSEIYEMFIKGYTEKQWGVKATGLNKDLAVRITINKGTENALTPNHRWNALPVQGYTEMVRGIIGDIPVKLNYDYLQHRDKVKANKFLIFTGPIDEFFNYKFGKLKYRGQSRKIEYLPGVTNYQPCIQVNYPDPKDPRIRTIEWKHLLPAEKRETIKGTVLTHETPFTPEESWQYEYPFPDKVNQNLYQQYKAEAEKLTNTLICGRLGEYRYYDMDQAIGRAMSLTGKILERFELGREAEVAAL